MNKHPKRALVLLGFLLFGESQSLFSMEQPPAPPSNHQEKRGGDSIPHQQGSSKRGRKNNQDEDPFAITLRTLVLSCASGDIQSVKEILKTHPSILNDRIKASFLVKHSTMGKQFEPYIRKSISGFLAACLCGRLEVVQELLQGNYSILDHKLGDMTEFDAAVESGNVAVLQVLCYRWPARISLELMRSLLRRSIIKKNVECVTFLCSLDDNSKQWDKKKFCEMLVECVELAAEYAPDPNGIILTTLKRDALTTMAAFFSPEESDIYLENACFYGALKGGHEEEVRNILTRKKVDVNSLKTVSTAYLPYTPLGLACVQGSCAIAHLLIDAGADVHKLTGCDGSEQLGAATKLTPVALAVLLGHFEVAELLISKGADIEVHIPYVENVSQTVLMSAIRTNNAPAMKFLLKHNVIVPRSVITKLPELAREVDPEVIRALQIGYDVQINALLEACKDGDIAWIKKRAQSIDLGVQHPHSGKTPLIIAAEHNQKAVLLFLLSEGVSVGMNHFALFGVHWMPEHMHESVRDLAGKGALEYIIQNDYSALFEAVVEHYQRSRDPQAPRHPFINSAYLLAARLGSEKYVRRLIELGADIQYRDARRCSALHYAVIAKQIRMVGTLCALGVAIDQRDVQAQTPLMIAVHNRQAGIAELLLDHLADPAECLEGPESPLYTQDPACVALLKAAEEKMQKRYETFFDYIENTSDHFSTIGTVARAITAEPRLLMRFCTTPKTIMNAILENKQGALAWLLRNNVNCDIIDAEGQTPLYIAAERGNLPLVQELIRRKVKIYSQDPEGNYIFASSAAASAGYKDVVLALIEYARTEEAMRDLPAELMNHDVAFSQRIIQSALTAAIGAQHYDVIAALLSQGALATITIAAESPLRAAFKKGNRQIVRLLLEHLSRNNPGPQDVALLEDIFSSAFEKGLFDVAATIARYLPAHHRQRVIAVYKNRNALYLSCRIGTRSEPIAINETIKRTESFLLAQLLDQPAVRAYLERPQQLAQREAQRYARLSRDDIALSPGNTQWTCLMLACIFGQYDIVSSLTTMGLPAAYYNARDAYGRTALMYALLYGNLDCALALIKSPHDAFGNVVLEDSQDTRKHTTFVNLCGAGIHLQDELNELPRNALFYAIFAAQYDELRTITELDQTRSRVKISKEEYSARFGANQVIDLLLRLGATFEVPCLALKLAAEIKDSLILQKVTSKTVQAHKDVLLNMPNKVKEKNP